MESNGAQRANRDLWLSILIAVLLAVYGLGASISEHIASWIRALAPSTPGLETFLDLSLKALYGWLLVMLFVAYRRWRAETARREELERVIENIRPDVLLVTEPDGTISTSTGPVNYIFGFSAEELRGRKLSDLLDMREASQTASPVATQLQQVGFDIGQAVCQHKDGHSFVLETVQSDIDNDRQVVVLLRDMTEHRRVRVMLEQSEERFATFMSHLPAIAMIRDPEGHFQYANPRLLMALGLNEKRIRSRTLYDIFDTETARQLESKDRKMLAAGESLTSTDEILMNGDKRVMLTSRFPLPQEDGDPFVGTIMLDITDMRRAEDERRKMELQMQHTQKLESLGVLGGGIAHDFNNLLVGILGHAELARTHVPDDSPVREHLNKVVVTAKRAADLANQLLAYAKDSKFAVEAADINEMVREMSNLLTVSISKKAILKCELATNLPPVECDPTRIRQVIMNLIVNASDALADQAGHITVRTGIRTCGGGELLDMAAQKRLPGGNYVFLQVRDTGCGMNKETIEKIFDPFFTTKLTGRGLGLAAVMGIVRSHHGAITVDSIPASGSLFAVYFPASTATADAHEEQEADDPNWTSIGSILVADDEKVVLDVASSMLTALGFTPVTVANGREALEAYAANKDTLKAVILDMSMPEMDGREAFEAIREISPSVPIIVSSGYSHDENDFTAYKGLAQPLFLQKPYQLDGLRRVLRNALTPSKTQE